MSKIYDQHNAAFAQVSAYVVVKNGERVATIALKFPRDDVGRLYAYVHWLGIEMVRGWASGCGYDKRSAAIESAVRRLPELSRGTYANGVPHHSDAARALYGEFIAAVTLGPDGLEWYRNLRDAGFEVWQAV